MTDKLAGFSENYGRRIKSVVDQYAPKTEVHVQKDPRGNLGNFSSPVEITSEWIDGKCSAKRLWFVEGAYYPRNDWQEIELYDPVGSGSAGFGQRVFAVWRGRWEMVSGGGSSPPQEENAIVQETCWATHLSATPNIGRIYSTTYPTQEEYTFLKLGTVKLFEETYAKKKIDVGDGDLRDTLSCFVKNTSYAWGYQMLTIDNNGQGTLSVLDGTPAIALSEKLTVLNWKQGTTTIPTNSITEGTLNVYDFQYRKNRTFKTYSFTGITGDITYQLKIAKEKQTQYDIGADKITWDTSLSPDDWTEQLETSETDTDQIQYDYAYMPGGENFEYLTKNESVVCKQSNMTVKIRYGWQNTYTGESMGTQVTQSFRDYFSQDITVPVYKITPPTPYTAFLLGMPEMTEKLDTWLIQQMETDGSPDTSLQDFNNASDELNDALSDLKTVLSAYKSNHSTDNLAAVTEANNDVDTKRVNVDSQSSSWNAAMNTQVAAYENTNNSKYKDRPIWYYRPVFNHGSGDNFVSLVDYKRTDAVVGNTVVFKTNNNGSVVLDQHGMPVYTLQPSIGMFRTGSRLVTCSGDRIPAEYGAIAQSPALYKPVVVYDSSGNREVECLPTSNRTKYKMERESGLLQITGGNRVVPIQFMTQE